MKQFHANLTGILEIPLLLMPKSSPSLALGQTFPVGPSARSLHVAASLVVAMEKNIRLLWSKHAEDEAQELI